MKQRPLLTRVLMVILSVAAASLLPRGLAAEPNGVQGVQVPLKLDRRLPQTRDKTTSVAFSSDGKLLLVAERHVSSHPSTRGRISLWQIDKPEPLWTTDSDDPVQQANFVEGTAQVIVAGRTLRVLSMTDGSVVRVLSPVDRKDLFVAAVGLGASRHVASLGIKGVEIWNTDTRGAPRRIPESGDATTTLAVSRDGTRIAFARRDNAVVVTDAHGVTSTVHRFDDLVTCVAFTPDDALIVGTLDGAFVCSAADAAQKSLVGPGSPVDSIAFAGNDAFLVVGSELNLLRSGTTELRTLEAHDRATLMVATSPAKDGARLVSVGQENGIDRGNCIKIWHLE